MTTAAAPARQQYIDLSDASLRYGISVAVLRCWLHNRRLTRYRPNRKILVKVEELENLIASSAE